MWRSSPVSIPNRMHNTLTTLPIKQTHTHSYSRIQLMFTHDLKLVMCLFVVRSFSESVSSLSFHSISNARIWLIHIFRSISCPFTMKHNLFEYFFPCVFWHSRNLSCLVYFRCSLSTFQFKIYSSNFHRTHPSWTSHGRRFFSVRWSIRLSFGWFMTVALNVKLVCLRALFVCVCARPRTVYLISLIRWMHSWLAESPDDCNLYSIIDFYGYPIQFKQTNARLWRNICILPFWIAIKWHFCNW